MKKTLITLLGIVLCGAAGVKITEDKMYEAAVEDYNLAVYNHETYGNEILVPKPEDRKISMDDLTSDRWGIWMTILENNGLLNRLFGLVGLGPFKMINTEGAVVLGMVYNFLPFMVLPLYTIMMKIDVSVIEAAQDLGANSVNVFARIIFPLSMPGIISGITMVFVPSVSTFIISKMLGGGANMLIGDLIQEQFIGGSYNPQLGSAMSLILMVVILLVMSVINRMDDEDKEGMLI